MPLWSKMQEVAGVGPRSNVLDVGCGGGNALKLAKSKGAKVSGTDSSQALLDYAKSIVDGDFRAGDMESLPFDDKTFNVVLATNSIQYSEDKVKSISEIKLPRHPRPANRSTFR